MQLEILKESDVSPELDAAIREILCICFPYEKQIFSGTRAWHGIKPSFVILLQKAGNIIAYLAVVDRIIKVAEEPVRVAGIHGVCVLPEYRGRRLSAKLLRAAMDKSDRLGFDLGLLFTGSDLIKHYASCGWKLLANKPIIRVDKNSTEITMPAQQTTMYYPLARPDFPPGPVHLQGNDW
jgi:GNAT superfamily N-acetyltransferase